MIALAKAWPSRVTAERTATTVEKLDLVDNFDVDLPEFLDFLNCIFRDTDEAIQLRVVQATIFAFFLAKLDPEQQWRCALHACGSHRRQGMPVSDPSAPA